jgi:uroporphyrinogen-III synthase
MHLTGRHNTPMRVVVTRPLPQCNQWVTQLVAAGIPASALPLLRIGPCPQPELVQKVVQDLLDASQPLEAVMVVSGAAFTELARALSPDTFRLLLARTSDDLRFWATGPGTAEVLKAAGVVARNIDLPGLTTHDQKANSGVFDSKHLWQQVAHQVQRGSPVLFVKGADSSGAASGNPWLVDQVTKAGGDATVVIAYQRLPPAWSEGQKGIADTAAHDGSVWLFSSTEGMDNLPDQNWQDAIALATHPRIAEKAQSMGFSKVIITEPLFASVLASLKSMHD